MNRKQWILDWAIRKKSIRTYVQYDLLSELIAFLLFRRLHICLSSKEVFEMTACGLNTSRGIFARAISGMLENIWCDADLVANSRNTLMHLGVPKERCVPRR